MPKTICLVDDEPEILSELGMMLSDEGYNIMTASSGSEAFAKIRKQRPHLVILDVIMPEMNGLEVLDQLKRDRSTSEIPVIMLTAKTDTGTLLEARERHAADYFMKPFNPDELLRMIRRHA